MSDLDYDALRKVAEAATSGPWESGTDGWVETVSGDGEDWCFVRRVGTTADITAHMLHGQPEADEQTERNAEHIATFDPPTVLRLLDLAQRAEASTGARALREAADQLDRDGMKRLGAHSVKQWLRARADHIEGTP